MTEEISARLADEHEAFSAYLISLFKPKDAKLFDETIAKLTPKEINDLYKQFKTMEGITFARMGAKLDYLQRLNGKCPEGYEIEKYMAGGCVKCRKKLLKNTPLMDKCGGRVKQRIKKGSNGVNLKATGFSTDPNYNTRLLSVDKCGGKMKKRISKKEKGSAFKPIEGGPGMTESTKGAKLNAKQSKVTKDIKKALRGIILPTAPLAKVRYKNGTLDYVPHAGFYKSDNDLIITGPDGSTLLRKIVSYPLELDKLDGTYGADTTYIETPAHRFWVTPQPRIEYSRSDGNLNTGEIHYTKSKDADIMKRRWQEAVKVAKDKRKKK